MEDVKYKCIMLALFLSSVLFSFYYGRLWQKDKEESKWEKD